MKIFFAVASIFLPIMGLAGTPDQDPLIAEIREQFKSANSTIQESDLKLGKRWICSSFDAELNSYDHSKTPVELGYFELFTDNVIKLKHGIDDELKEEIFAFLSDTKLDHRFEGSSAGGNISSNDFKQIRKNDRGDLIIEMGFDRGRPQPYSNEANFIPAISHSGYRVMNYTMCLLSDII